MKQLIIFFFFLSGLCYSSQNVYGQLTIYNGVSLQAGSSTSGTPVLPSSVSPSTGSTSFEGEYQIVLGPDCQQYPTCSPGTVNTFLASGFDAGGSNYFIARLVPPKAYAELKKQLDGSYCQTLDNKLNFRYIEKYMEGNLNYQIYDYQRNAMSPLPIVNSIVVGDNFVVVDLSAITTMVSATDATSYYTLEVTNKKNEKTVLRFRYSPNEQ
jgi:hypothetical protein